MARRHHVDLLSFIDSEAELDQVAPLEEMCGDVRTILRGRSPEAADILHLRPRTIVTEYDNPEMRQAIACAAAGGNYDLIQFEYLQAGYLAPSVSNVPFVLTNMECQHAALLRQSRMARSVWDRWNILWEWQRMLHLELEICTKFRLIITMTDGDARSLTKFKPSLPVVVNNTGVDCEHFASQGHAEPFTLVFVGYYRHTPNVDAMLYFCDEVLPRVWEHFPQTTLSVVGGGLPPEVRALAKDPRIRVTDWVADIRPYIEKSAIYVVPIRLGVGIRGKILEAWAMGKAVVATITAAEGLRACHGENILLAESSEALTDHIKVLLSDETLRNRLGQGGRRTVEQFYSWPISLAKHEQLYSNVLARSKQS